jgi:hypothetical protein
MDNFEEKQLKKIAKILLLNTISDITIGETSSYSEIGYNSYLTLTVNRPYGKEVITLTLINHDIKTVYNKKDIKGGLNE